jgi:formylglycine-generating enzyme required for sulfatase activity
MKIIAAAVLGFIVVPSVFLSRQQPGALTAVLPTGVRMEFVRIPPGEFMMGCSPNDNQCDDDEKPAHPVRILRGFEMARYEVTAAQWQAIVVTSPFSPMPGSGDDHALGLTSWNDAQNFLTRLNERNDGFRYRLPTEAEWEYAARAGSSGPVAGPNLQATAWFGQNVVSRPESVGQKQPNAWGLYDMLGNAWEWVEDRYDSGYYAASPPNDPKGPVDGPYRVLRGGSSLSNAKSARLSERHYIGAPANPDYYGFRPLREPIR